LLIKNFLSRPQAAKITRSSLYLKNQNEISLPLLKIYLIRLQTGFKEQLWAPENRSETILNLLRLLRPPENLKNLLIK
jgi:hypothetical protein